MNTINLPHSFQKASSLEDCVNKLKMSDRKRLQELQYYDFPPISVEVREEDSDIYTFQLTLGGQLQLYNSTILQLQSIGYMYRIHDNSTRISYRNRVLWKFPLFIYGAVIIGWIIVFYTKSFPITLLGIVLVMIRIVWEGINARNRLSEMQFLIEIILAS